jgi:NitT/TauT family transport system substrate-binding protein
MMSISFKAVTGLAVVFACIGGMHSAAAADKVRVFCPTFTGNAPLFAAQALGYFKDQGLDVEITFNDQPSEVFAAMETGMIDVDVRTIGEYEIRPRTDDSPGVIIGTIDHSVGGDGVIADGSIKTVADLKGKLVAVTPNAPAELLLKLEMRKIGMKPSDIRTTNIEFADTVAVFSDLKVSAVASSQPFLDQTIKVVAARKPWVLVSSANSSYISDMIIARKADLAANPDKYRRFLIGLYKGVAYSDTKNPKFLEAVAPVFGLSTQDLKDSIDSSLAFTSLAEAKDMLGSPDKPGTLFKLFDELMEVNMETGSADQKLTAARHIDSSIIAGITDKDIQ